MWGEEPPATAIASLHNHVGRLRRVLSAEGASRLSSTPYGLLLRVADGELDVQEFTALLARARAARAQHDWQDVSHHTSAALSLWRGQPLSDLPELHSLESEVRHLCQTHLQALEWHFEAELQLGRHAEVTPELSRWASRHPLHEALHVQLVTALYRSGRQAEALEAFEAVRSALSEELGVGPGPALRGVHLQVLTSDPVLLELRTTAPESVRAGAQAVVVARDAHDSQAATASRAEATPTPQEAVVRQRSIPVPVQLPADTALFTGRQRELRQVCQLLERTADGAGPRVVALTGMGGVGKSALAVRAAHLLRDQFPDGQLHVDLRGFGAGTPRPPHEVLATLLADLHPAGAGASAQPLPEDTDDRAALLRTTLADQRVIVVLDNARDSDQVLPLLPGTGASAVIVTSRAALPDLPGAHHVPLAPMDIEEQRALLSAACGVERVEHDLDGAMRILAACAGLPLALRIVAARLAARPAWPLGVMADRLGEGGPGRLSALTAGRWEVRATFASSYLALRDSEQATEREAARAFRMLGLWPEQVFTPACAAALLHRSPTQAGELLELLVDAHLLQSPAPLRYRFHDLLGEYAAERADEAEPAEEREAARLRLGVWYALALESARLSMREGGPLPPRLEEEPPAPLPVFADEAQAMAWCREELANIGDVIGRAGNGPRPDLAWRLAVWLFGYMRNNWWTGQWEEYLKQALRIAEQHDDRLGRAWVLRNLGACHGMARRLEKSIEALRTALTLFDEPAGRVAVLSNLSLAYGFQGQADQALAHVREALDLHRRSGGGGRLTAILVSSLADALRVAGQHAEASARYREALALWRDHGDASSVAITLANFGDVLGVLGRREEAFAALREALDTLDRIGDIALVADTLVIAARTHTRFAEWHDARTRVHQAIDLADRHHMTAWLSDAHDVLASIENAHSRGA
ncbi:AfsR/SARP family transcriptional regulator [Kitasatospora cathayae]|uniref:BTAD domain-containing putative transcriptional regulator n=1 Tax=Kitasatospora cathayae TaxID=3004092 RepID=A0ABY7QEV6_9ACTN|nr:BTAD domain-containing putative transcriptional regulator [Kitasatospora sp. HUAS 3-15]WBP91290.1 BTAD domain-containing putative transcriptional regulator [Kitasatospora sp. HUAS 3-15]